MRTLVSLLATAALVGGVTIASAQSGSPTAASGPMAGGGSASNATQGVGGTQRIETTGQATTTKKGEGRGGGSPMSRQDRGRGAPALRGAEFSFELAKSRTRACDAASSTETRLRGWGESSHVIEIRCYFPK